MALEWLYDLRDILSNPHQFFQVQQQRRRHYESAIQFLVLCLALMGALRLLAISFYPDTLTQTEWLLSVLVTALGFPFTVAINSGIVQSIYSAETYRGQSSRNARHTFRRNLIKDIVSVQSWKKDRLNDIETDEVFDAAIRHVQVYAGVFAAFCYAAVVPALTLWLVPALSTTPFILPVLFLIAVASSYILFLGLDAYTDIPFFGQARYGTPMFSRKKTWIARSLFIALTVLMTVEYALLSIPDAVAILTFS